MQEITLQGNQIVLSIKRGTVVEHDKFTETHVTTSGGGGYLHEGSGFVTPVRSRSESITTQEFWLKLDDGLEEQITLSQHDFGVRTSHRVSLCLAGVKGHEESKMVGLVNHSTGESVAFPVPRLPGLTAGSLSFFKRFKRTIGAFTPGLVALVLSTFIGEPFSALQRVAVIGGLIVAFIFLLHAMNKWRTMKKQRNIMDSDLKQAINALLKEAKASVAPSAA